MRGTRTTWRLRDGPLLLALAAGALALAAVLGGGEEPPRYRLEHRRPARVRVLATAASEAAGRAAFRAQAPRLEAAGEAGELVLVEAASGLIVTWHDLTPRPGR